MMTFARLYRAAIPALLLVLAVTACSGGNEGAPTPERPPAGVVLERAQAAMENVPQFQFELTHSNGTTTLEGGLQLRKASGTVVAPDDSMSLDAEADLGRIFVRVQAIVIGERTWMTNPLTGNWSTIAPQDSPFSFLDPVGLVANVLQQTTDASYAESGSADASKLVINGKVPAEALEPLVGTVIRGATLDTTLVIDAETFLLHSARLSGKLQPNDDESFFRLITFSGFDDDLIILPPGVK